MGMTSLRRSRALISVDLPALRSPVTRTRECVSSTRFFSAGEMVERRAESVVEQVQKTDLFFQVRNQVLACRIAPMFKSRRNTVNSSSDPDVWSSTMMTKKLQAALIPMGGH